MNLQHPSLTLIGSLVILAGCRSPTEPGTNLSPDFAKSPNAPVNSASGGGTVDVPAGRSTYAFHASVNGAGIVSGGFEIHFSSTDANVHGDVTCFVVDGNQAWFGGVVTRSSDETLVAVGSELVWRAIDNGEGTNATADQISAFASGPWTADRCVEKPLFGTRDWTNGNVQIR